MKVLTTINPFASEWVVGVSPPPSAQIIDWNKRLNLFTGRALTQQALNSEQSGIAGRFAMGGLVLSPGIVAGLAIDLDQTGTSLSIAPGFGLTAFGEDVTVLLPLTLAVRGISVYAPTVILDGGPAPAPGDLVGRKLGDSLDTIIKKNLPVPHVGILVLQPVVADVAPDFNASDPCAQDPQNDAFNNAQLVDGCRLVYYSWPSEWLPLPPSSERWRNLLAYAIFDREAQTGPDDLLPWLQVGLPLGMIAFDDKWNALFVDQYSVARAGGKAKRRTPLLENAGNEFLWQGRMQQFVEQVIDLKPSQVPATAIGADFRFMPPAGVVPRTAAVFSKVAVNPGATRVTGTPFFPRAWQVNAVPVPTEQLDFAIQASASLAKLDAFWPETVDLLVPVPQAWFEPDLLQILAVDPAFQQAVDQFSHQRALWLKRRQDVRGYFTLLQGSLNGTTVVFPDPDPDAVGVEQPANTEIDATIDAFKSPELTYGTTGGKIDALESLKKTLAAIPGVQADPDVGKLGTTGPPENPGVGLQQLIDKLQAKLDNANDNIDFGFLHVQTDIYRARQNMLGNDAGTRLATSPALAMIAQGLSAAATKEDLANLVAKLKQTPARAAAPPPAAAGGGSTKAPKFQANSLFLAGAQRATAITGGGTLGTLGRGMAFANGGAGKQGTPGEQVKFTNSTGESALFVSTSSSTRDVTEQRPIVGVGYDLRSTSVVERLQDPPSTEVKQFTVASKYSVLSSFIGMAQDPQHPGIVVDDISVPGFLDNKGAETTKKFSEITPAILNEILNGAHDPIISDDEAGRFGAGVRAMEHTTTILRLLEGRAQAYQTAIDQCNAAATTITGEATQAGTRLTAIAQDLGQTRHDFAFAQALLAEETARVQGINDRRDQIVSQQVKFLAFVRPRSTEALTSMQLRSLDPALTSSPVPACLARNITAPPELRAVVNLLREAPLNWFVNVPPLLSFLDRIDVLQSVVVNAKLRAGFKLFQSPDPDLQTGPGELGPSILNLYAARKQTITNYRLSTSNLDLTTLAGQTWEQTRVLATGILSIGDLVDNGHYHPNVPRVSAQEIENILKVASCLYSEMGAVLPIIRLNWAERLAQINDPINLSNLGSLPNWSQVPILERKEMQSLTDWLFSRVVTGQSDAVNHINDVVRVCVLLASHVPISDVSPGNVIRPTPIMVDSRVDLAADLSRVSVGMHVLLYSGNQAVARGVVENLADGQATAHILTTAKQQLTVDTNTKAHFAAPDAFERNPFTAGKLL